jgi:UDP-3-O-[3-hydroxymyristoyl] glucosamine N-acyltransferase
MGLSMKASEVFSDCQITRDFDFAIFGRTASDIVGTCTYLYDAQYVKQTNQNDSLCGVITTQALSTKIQNRLGLIIADDPAGVFFSAYHRNVLEMRQHMAPTYIHPTAVVAPHAIIAEQGVVVGAGTVIEDGVIIKSGVEIGENSVIRSGAILGGEGYEIKTINGIPSIVAHGDKVVIGNHVEIQYNTCVDKGFLGRDTRIGDFVKIDNLTSIAHGVYIGAHSKIAAKVIIAGRVTIGSHVWVGPGCVISNAISIGDRAKITIGSTIVSNVPEETVFTGYFAIEHSKFLKQYYTALLAKAKV